MNLNCPDAVSKSHLGDLHPCFAEFFGILELGRLNAEARMEEVTEEMAELGRDGELGPAGKLI